MEIFREDRENTHARAYYKFVELANRMEIRVKDSLKPFGMTHAQLNVLYHLARISPGKISAGDLKQKLLVNNPDLTRLIDRLVQRGWVHRNICPENRRQVDIHITEEGISIFREAHQRAREAVGNFFRADLSSENAISLYQILNKIQL